MHALAQKIGLSVAGWMAGLGPVLAATPTNATNATNAPEGRISFSRQVQPLLSEHCYQCHGPDASTRKPKSEPLRIDRAQFAFAPREDGQPVILKGNAANSALVRRMRTSDPDELMPPPSAHKPMKPAQIAVIERWINEGADYEEHWAFIPPRRPALPEAGAAWAVNPVDRFVAAPLAKAGLQPNPPEDKARLLRRLTFDLTGLPPSPREVESFGRDRSPGAYEKAVDRLLATDASAEHFARQWLDAVRYADTQGIHHDHYRSVWPYRDWVIAAFKTNMPFDRFTVEQLGGDLLPEATLDQKVASGYNRLLPTTGEGGAIPEEYNAIYAKDRVDTTSAVWLGLTTGCASCHDHKFDPVSMKDFYSLTAFFRNNTLRALDDSRGRDYPPTVFVPAPNDRARWPGLQEALSSKGAALKSREESGRPDFEKWLSTVNPNRLEAPSKSRLALHLPLNEASGPARGTMDGKEFEYAAADERKAGVFGPAPLITGGQALAGEGPVLTREGRLSFGGFIQVEGKPSGAIVSRMDKAEKYRGWDLFITEGKPTVHIVDEFPATALKVVAKEALTPYRWYHLLAVFDGTRKGADAISLYLDGRRLEVEVSNNSLGTNIVTDVPVRLGARSDGPDKTSEVLEKGKVWLQDLRIYERVLTPVEAARWAASGLVREFLARPEDLRGTNGLETIYRVFLAGFDGPSLALREALEELRSEESGIRERGGISLVMEEKKDTKPVAHILTRGNYLSKAAEVGAATPELLPAMAPEAPRNRLGLGQWLVSRENPLPARVTANRVWHSLFGAGIVETPEDFGIMGARPTHPELLDWLAVEFMESGWNYRQLVKTIVMSATYRQSARVTPEKLEKDPLNKLLSRGPRSRLEAEQIRDQALAASGLLVRKIGGPPVKPYQPDGVWEAVAMKDSNTRDYRHDQGENLYRRSLYTFWKRTAPPASMEILNAPSREVFCVRRERSNTPLQAFVTMNDPQFVEAARHLATRGLQAARKFDSQLDAITLPLLARRFAEPERAVARKTLDRARAFYRQDPAAARELIAVGESKPDPKLPPEELAAWTLLASQVINLDEALTK